MSGHVIQCWSCDTRLTLGERNENDGDCLECGVEIALDDYLDQAMTERDELRAQVEVMRAALRIFVGCAYPVSATINQRGHNWCEAYLDQALDTARAALQAKP